jgi:hypothetical protein
MDCRQRGSFAGCNPATLPPMVALWTPCSLAIWALLCPAAFLAAIWAPHRLWFVAAVQQAGDQSLAVRGDPSEQGLDGLFFAAYCCIYTKSDQLLFVK